ncbi:MAG: hypothetical protein JNK37_19350 [Verrucomicrobiales bacterium]|nr:hypothetical protein [Verrucomicrobiales bacterium]
MEDKLQSFRQPIVTATGILLGFILNFAANWVKTETPMPDWLAYLVGACVLTGIVMLIAVLHRVLRMDYPRDQAEAYHARTLLYLIAGVALSFAGALIDMFSHFMQE